MFLFREVSMVKVTGISAENIKKFNKLMARKAEKYDILFKIGAETGLRITDILNIKVTDYYAGTVIEQKTKKAKEIKLSDKTKKQIANHIKANNLQLHNYIIFSTIRRVNKPLSRRQAHYVIRGVSGQLGLKNVGTHSLRKTYAREHFKKHHNLEALQQELNHKYITTTLMYLFDDLNEIKL